MMSRLKIGVRAKLFGGFAAVSLGFVVALVLGWVSIGSVANQVKTEYGQAVLAQETSAAAYNIHVSQIQNVLDGGGVEAMRRSDRATFESDLRKLDGTTSGAEELQLLARVKDSYAQWRSIDKQVDALAKSGRKAEATKLIDGAANRSADQLSSRLDAFENHVRQGANESSASATAHARLLMGLFAGLALLLAGVIAFLLSGQIAGAARRMLAAARGIAVGDVDQDVRATSSDELGQTANAFAEMIDYLRTTAAAAERIADNDLTVDVEPKSERDALGTAFARMAANLREMVGNVAQAATLMGASSEQMASSSSEAGNAVGEIARAVQDVASGAERQVRIVEQARSSTEATGHVAEQASVMARDGVAAAAQAASAMQELRESTDRVTDAIRTLSTKSEQIGGIVETITGLAAQTNLLALNAAIEAARAGEQGRGFAVVAEEVRKLAEESQQSAASIASLVQEIQGETDRTVAVVEATAGKAEASTETVETARRSFEEIGASVESINDQIGRIVEATAEVASVAEQSSASTEEVAASTEQTSASAQEIAASAHELAQTAEELTAIVGRFKLAA
jgi:methyl-accepting chemotaxis protein